MSSYTWVILALLFIGHLMVFGMRSAFGAYITHWEAEFNISRSAVTTITLLGMAVFATFQPFMGKLNDLWGRGIILTTGVVLVGGSLFLTSMVTEVWQIFAVYGVILFIGLACCTNAVVAATTTSWFTKRRGLALGLVMSGMAVGNSILYPVNIYVIETMGWRTAMGTLGLIILVIVGPLFAIFMRSKPEEKGLKPYGYEESDSTLTGVPDKAALPVKSEPFIRVFKQKAIWLLMIPYFICGLTDVGIIHTHFIPMMGPEGRGFPEMTVAAVLSVIAILNIAGTIVTGYLSDHFNLKRQLAVIYSVRAVSIVFLVLLDQPWLLFVFAVMFGAVEMASIAPVNAITVKLFDSYSPGVILGIIALSHQLGGAAGSWIPGLIYDMTGSYTIVLLISAVLLLVAAGLSLMIRVPDKKALEQQPLA